MQPEGLGILGFISSFQMPGFCVLEAKQREERAGWDLPILSGGPEKGSSWAPLLMLQFAVCLVA